MIEQFLQDLRYAARAMRHNPAFALVATLCLAIGISVNTAAFSLLNTVLFRDYPGVERRAAIAGVFIGFSVGEDRANPGPAAVPDYDVLRAGLPGFSGLATSGNIQLSVRVQGEARAVRGSLVSSNFFDVLGTRPTRGRFMQPADDAATLEQVVVISHQFWTRALAAHPDVVGQVLAVGTRSLTIIGVAPEGFFGLYPAEVIDPDVGAPELFIPLAAAPFLRAQSAAAPIRDRWLQVFGRRAPGVSIDAIQSQADAAAAQLAAAYPADRHEAVAVVRSGLSAAQGNVELIGVLLFAMVVPAIILLVSCANLANQLLARAVQRRREIAVRLSLGATRSRVVRQLLAETALLALMASAIGVLLARWLLDAVRVWALATPFRVAIDLRVLAFTLGLALLTALAFGLVPALGATRPDLSSGLKDGATGMGYQRSRLRSALVVVQMAASLALIAVSSVFARAAQLPPSADVEALARRSLMLSTNLDLLGFDSVTGRAYQAALMERLDALPGVEAVGLAPFSMFEMLGSQMIRASGKDAGWRDYYDVAGVSGAWFEATNTPLLRGRLLTAAELDAPPTVAVVNEQLAREVWGPADPLGQSLRIGSDSAPITVTVVGIIPTRQQVAYREAEGLIVIPGGRQYSPRTHVYIRTSSDAQTIAAVVREAARALDPRVPLLTVRTLEEASAVEGAPLTGLASGMAALGGVALALAALGLFGVLSFIVAQRRYEIGVRIALGAQRGDVVRMVVRQALTLGAGGVIAGMLVAVATVAMLRAIIHGLEPLDLPVFAGAALTMLLVALLASALPARRAASVDPIRTLRAE